MKQIQKNLNQHTIICGFGDQGQAAAAELQLRGVAPDRVVVIDSDEGAGQAAADRGFIALRGNASSEEMLRLALIERAKTIIVTTGRDDSNLLIVLTARDLNRGLNVITSVRSDENFKLMKRGGASTVVMSSNLSGRILASAAAGEHSPGVLTDILSSGGKLRLVERQARLNEVGRRPDELAGKVLIQILRDGQPCSLAQLKDWEIAGGDTLLYLEENP